MYSDSMKNGLVHVVCMKPKIGVAKLNILFSKSCLLVEPPWCTELRFCIGLVSKHCWDTTMLDLGQLNSTNLSKALWLEPWDYNVVVSGQL